MLSFFVTAVVCLAIALAAGGAICWGIAVIQRPIAFAVPSLIWKFVDARLGALTMVLAAPLTAAVWPIALSSGARKFFEHYHFTHEWMLWLLAFYLAVMPSLVDGGLQLDEVAFGGAGTTQDPALEGTQMVSAALYQLAAPIAFLASSFFRWPI